ncbi:MAG: hypothetical protein EPO09_12475, partial [Aquabacterium sp.]|uniref:hypothetical protein n=1 Tax=Aquabacterium sp. TaxID=1872578 RepID=UPI001227464E
MLKRIVLLAFSFSSFWSTCHAQTFPVTRMQNSISGAIAQKAYNRGFTVADPRYGATLDLVSGQLVAVAGSTAAAITLGTVTAPAWASVAIAAGVGVVVSTGVSLALKGAWNWLFSNDLKTITQHSSDTLPTGNGLNKGGPYWVSSILSVYGSDPTAVITTAISLNWVGDSTSYYQLGNCTSTTVYMSCLVTRVNKTSGYQQTGYAGVGATYQTSGAPGTCQPGFVYRNASCIAVSAQVSPDVAGLTAQAAINNIPASELLKPLNPALVATLADKAWRDAAAQPGYSGLPYVASDPITAAEVDAWRLANPNLWPTVQDFVNPQPSTNSPWKLPGNATVTQQDPTQQTVPSVNPSASSAQVNLGADPGIGSPSLETTPTAQQILEPLLDLFPDFRSFVVPSHQATCPKPTFTVFGKQIVMDAHCT